MILVIDTSLNIISGRSTQKFIPYNRYNEVRKKKHKGNDFRPSTVLTINAKYEIKMSNK